jgi:hypothetical protein
LWRKVNRVGSLPRTNDLNRTASFSEGSGGLSVCGAYRKLETMREGGFAGVALVLSGLCFGGVAHAQNDPLSSSDYRWLHENLNVPPESLTLQDLTADQKAHVYALINTKKRGADKKVMDSADYLYRVNGEDFENTLKRSEELIVAPLPSRD